MEEILEIENIHNILGLHIGGQSYNWIITQSLALRMSEFLLLNTSSSP